MPYNDTVFYGVLQDRQRRRALENTSRLEGIQALRDKQAFDMEMQERKLDQEAKRAALASKYAELTGRQVQSPYTSAPQVNQASEIGTLEGAYQKQKDALEDRRITANLDKYSTSLEEARIKARETRRRTAAMIQIATMEDRTKTTGQVLELFNRQMKQDLDRAMAEKNLFGNTSPEALAAVDELKREIYEDYAPFIDAIKARAWGGRSQAAVIAPQNPVVEQQSQGIISGGGGQDDNWTVLAPDGTPARVLRAVDANGTSITGSYVPPSR